MVVHISMRNDFADFEVDALNKELLQCLLVVHATAPLRQIPKLFVEIPQCLKSLFTLAYLLIDLLNHIVSVLTH